MKPPPFDCLRPTTLDEALRMLAQHGDEAKILAGGQSLVPMMNFRLAAPRLLIDINRIAALSGIEATSDGLRLGALVRWHELEKSSVVAAHNPLLQAAVRHIAHFQIRNRGTVGGSSAHADPAAEFPAVAIACDARFTVRSAVGTRVLCVDDFFRGPLETALAPDELLIEICFPAWPATRRWGFQEFARRAGDFALAGAIALLDLDDSGACFSASLVSFAAGDRPLRLARAEACLRGQTPTRALLAEGARFAADDCDAKADMHAPADYRRSLFETLMVRALCAAFGVDAREAD
jgi:carbon-monoxide dehydrogenase medium subunit